MVRAKKVKATNDASDSQDGPQVFSKALLLEALQGKKVQRFVPELGGIIFLKEMDALEQVDLMDQRIKPAEDGAPVDPKENIHFMAKLLAKVLVNEQGNPLFDEDEYILLSKSKFKLLNVLTDHAMDVNGMSTKSVAAIEGNSEPGPISGSLTN